MGAPDGESKKCAISALFTLRTTISLGLLNSLCILGEQVSWYWRELRQCYGLVLGISLLSGPGATAGAICTILMDDTEDTTSGVVWHFKKWRLSLHFWPCTAPHWPWHWAISHYLSPGSGNILLAGEERDAQFDLVSEHFLSKFWNHWIGNKLIMGFYSMHYPYKGLKFNTGLLLTFWLLMKHFNSFLVFTHSWLIGICFILFMAKLRLCLTVCMMSGMYVDNSRRSPRKD